MPAFLVLAFVIVPLAELVVIIQVGQVLGTGWTVGLLVVDSLVGAWLLRREGTRVWRDFRNALSEGRWPGDEVTQGGLVIVGGTLLLTPGFLTDVVGLLLLLPPSRALLSRVIRARVTPAPIRGFQQARARRGVGAPGASEADPRVWDVEVVEVERDTPDEGGSASDEGGPAGPVR